MHFSFSKSNEEKNSFPKSISLSIRSITTSRTPKLGVDMDRRRKHHQRHPSLRLPLGFRLAWREKYMGLCCPARKHFSLSLTSLFHLLFLFHSLNANRYQAYTKKKKNKRRSKLNGDDDDDRIENGGSVRETHRQTRDYNTTPIALHLV